MANEATAVVNTGIDGVVAPPTQQGQLVPITPTTQLPAKVSEIKKQINLRDTQSVISFGMDAQREVTKVSETMLQGVRAKDTGPAGQSLTRMVTTLRGLNFNDIKPGQSQGLMGKVMSIFGKGADPLVKFLAQYETVDAQVAAIKNDLEKHRVQLLRDIVMLDKLYDATQGYFENLDLYIAAGEERLREINEVEIPALAAKAEASNDMVDAQALRDLGTARDTLDRKVHDLKLTRQVTLQGLPSIRMVQDNDKGLVEKIQSQIINTIPLWQQQLALAVTQWRQQDAAKASKASSDMTNDLLLKNSEMLKMNNTLVRGEIERGIYDVETIKKSNENLISSINESISIAEEGRRRREQAEQDLIECEAKLKDTLRSASQRTAAMITQRTA
jgi:uncharacterized protein YaaN involved in tellurite resistance